MPTPTTDFSIFDGRELVSYAPASDDPVENVPALRRPLTQSGMRNVERYVALLQTDVVFHLDGTSLAAKTLAAGDTITDSHGVTWSPACERKHLTICRRGCRHSDDRAIYCLNHAELMRWHARGVSG